MFFGNEYERLFNAPMKKSYYDKDAIYFNEDTVFHIDIVDGVRYIMVGDPGSGKSYALAVILNQLNNAQMFDPTGKFGAILKEQGTRGDWEFYSLQDAAKKRAFKMNVEDLHPRIINSIFPKVEPTPKKTFQRQALEEFILKGNKTYSELEALCDGIGLMHIFKDISKILHPSDNAPKMESLLYGKKVIYCEGLSTKNAAIGVYLQSLIGFKSSMSLKQAQEKKNFVVTALDEGQDFCKYETPLGNAFSEESLQGRKFGIGNIVAGSAYNKIHPDVRAKSNLKFVFRSPGMTNRYKSEGINIIKDDWEKLEDYHCFLFSSDGEYNGVEGHDWAKPSTFFVEARKEKDRPSVVIEKDATVFNFQV